jgi:hypothetical protein
VLVRGLKLTAALAAAAAALAMAVPAHAASPLVLQPREAPGLRPARVSVASATRELASALRPARLPARRAGEAAASRYVRGNTELLSAAFVLRNPRAAEAALRKATASRRLAKNRVRVGERGWLLRRRGRPEAPVVVVWRRNRGVAAIVLRARRGASELAVAYARLADLHVSRALTETAWERTVARIGANGRVSRRVALDLFALAYAPLPATKRPPGARGKVDPTFAGDLIDFVWSTLAPAQQRAAAQLLGVTDVEPAKRRTRTFGDRFREWPGTAAGRVDEGDPNFRPDDKLQRLAEQFVSLFQDALDHELRLKLLVGSTTSPFEGLAATTTITPEGVKSLTGSICRVRVHAQEITGRELFEAVLAHEVFHCFQRDMAQETGSFGYLLLPWVVEGTAEWAAFSVRPLPWEYGLRVGVGSAYFNRYLRGCTERLFARTYDGLGFFAHAYDATGDTWKRMKAILGAGTDAGSYTAAGGNGRVLLDTWASSVYSRTEYGYDWIAHSPLTPPADASCPAIALTGPAPVKAEPYTLSPYELSPKTFSLQKPLLHVQIDGDARLGDRSIDTTDLKDAWFCLRKACACPVGQQGKPPPAPPLGPLVFLGLTGGSRGSKGTISTVSLKEYCRKRQPPPPPPPGGPPIGGSGAGCSVGAAPRSVASDTATAAAGGGCGSSNGDPHLHTFDGRFYDFQAAGEFVLVRSRADGLEVQAREEPYPSSNAVAINTAVAMRVEGDRVVVSRGEPVPVVRVNGSGFLPASKPLALPHGGRIRVVQGEIEVAWKDGTLARVWSVSTWGVAFLLRPVATRQGTLTGLLGNFDGNEVNDFVTRQGRRLDTTAVIGYDERAYRLLYRVFGDSWRISQRQSLFDYAPGQSTRTFTNLRFPARIVRARDLPPRQRRAAERTCRRLHIRNARLLQDCVLDVGVTGDNRFATSARQLERTAGKFGKPQKRRRGPPTTSAVGRWTRVASGPSATAVPSVTLAGSTVVAAYATGAGAAETATFSLSPANAVVGLRRNPIVSGWTFLGNLSLIPRAGGGLQLLLHGIHGGTTADPLSGETLFPRDADGSFGAPTRIASADQSALGGAAALAPDGTPIWASVTRGFWLWRGSPEATSAGLPNLPAPAYVPSVGRDAMGRYWLAWYVLGSTAQTKGLYLVQIDPQTLQPVSAPQRAPSSGTLDNLSSRLAVACAAACRIVYLAPGAVVSWAFGERIPTRVAAIPRGHRLRPDLAAAYTARGRLWVAWFDRTASRYSATLGNGAGAGGRIVSLGHPAGTVQSTPGALAGVDVGERLALVVTWSGRSAFTRHVKVVSP